MKEVVELLAQNNIIFKTLNPLPPKAIGSKKRIDIYLGVQLNNYYTLIFSIQRKSRVLIKDVQEYQKLHQQLEEYNQSKIYKKYILLDAPLCSKAKAKLQELGWRVFLI